MMGEVVRSDGRDSETFILCVVIGEYGVKGAKRQARTLSEMTKTVCIYQR